MRFQRIHQLFNIDYLRSIIHEGSRFQRFLIIFILSIIISICFIEFIVFSAKLDSLFRFCNKLERHSKAHDDPWIPQTELGTRINIRDNATLAKFLHKEVRVLCWIMTYPENHIKKALHLKRTWGKRCNKLIFMSSVNDTQLNSVALHVEESHNNLWAKTKLAFRYIYENHMNDADWFFKAEDDTYVIVENLRYMLYEYSPDTPIFFGCQFNTSQKTDTMSGGAGYVLSREALRRFIELALPNPILCNSNSFGKEDVELSKCLLNVDVRLGDSRDKYERHRFFPVPPGDDYLPIFSPQQQWTDRYAFLYTYEGFQCCSKYAISFNFVEPKNMYIFDYFLYNLRPVGVPYKHELLPPKIKTDGLTTNYNLSKFS